MCLCGLWCSVESLNFSNPQLSPLYIVRTKLDTCPSLFRKSIIKICCIVTSFANTFYLQEALTWLLHFLREHTSSPTATKGQLSGCSTSHDEALWTSLSAGITSLSGHQARQPHLLFPSTSFEMWLITADACSPLFYCLINLSRSLAIRRKIQSSRCSALRYTEGEKISAQAGPIVPLLMAAMKTSSSQLAWNSLAKHAKEMDMFDPHWMHPKSGILNSAHIR